MINESKANPTSLRIMFYGRNLMLSLLKQFNIYEGVNPHYTFYISLKRNQLNQASQSGRKSSVFLNNNNLKWNRSSFCFIWNINSQACGQNCVQQPTLIYIIYTCIFIYFIRNENKYLSILGEFFVFNKYFFWKRLKCNETL